MFARKEVIGSSVILMAASRWFPANSEMMFDAEHIAMF
jgi:hypothetical protein